MSNQLEIMPPPVDVPPGDVPRADLLPPGDTPPGDVPPRRTKQFLTPLQTLRLARTLTQADLAGLMRIAQQTLSKYETGEVIPPADHRARLATILGVQSEVLWPPSELARY